VLAANQVPDHVTIVRFRVWHEQALAGFLVKSLRLCAAAGMVRVGTVTLDGTELAANAADKANRTHEQLEAEVAEILREAAEIDQREDRLFGDACGDELPKALACKADRAGPPAPGQGPAGGRGRRAGAGLPAAGRHPRRGGGRQGHQAAHAQTPPAGDPQPQGDRQHHRPRQPLPAHPQRHRLGLQRPGGHHPGAGDRGRRTHLRGQRHPPTPAHAQGRGHHAGAAGIAERPEAALADSGYWSIDNLTTIHDAPELLIPPARHSRQGKPRKDGKPSASRSDGLRAAMTAKLKSQHGKARYAKRREAVEPVFGQLKEQQGARRFHRRGRRACNAEWKLLCGTHNLLKLWRHTAIRQAA
jgi:hypothetical protein